MGLVSVNFSKDYFFNNFVQLLSDLVVVLLWICQITGPIWNFTFYGSILLLLLLLFLLFLNS